MSEGAGWWKERQQTIIKIYSRSIHTLETKLRKEGRQHVHGEGEVQRCHAILNRTVSKTALRGNIPATTIGLFR